MQASVDDIYQSFDTILTYSILVRFQLNSVEFDIWTNMFEMVYRSMNYSVVILSFMLLYFVNILINDFAASYVIHFQKNNC